MGKTHVAFIRGINVGRAKRVAMADLRALFERLGYQDVRTVLNSGNVIFTAPKTARGDAASRIERAMAEQLRISARVFVISDTELREAVIDNPLRAVAADPARLMVYVLADPAGRAKLTRLAREQRPGEAIALGRRVAYLWCPHGFMASSLVVQINSILGDATTARNMATMTKILAKIPAPW